jgi:SAM-dependent methyltransferase
MIRQLLYALKIIFKQHFVFKPFSMLNGLGWYVSDYNKLKKEQNEAFSLSNQYLFPCITDKTADNPMDYIYFYQNAWAAGRIFQYKPVEHFDIGSQVGFVGIVSQFVKTTFLDIRTIDVNLPNLSFKEADILNLPFPNKSIESVSCICVIEHIGLGRYGDSINAYGSEKAIAEILRVTKQNGNIVISVPIDNASKIYFNAHRAFTRSHILSLFSNCTLVNEKYIYGTQLCNDYDAQAGFGTGLFHFRKNEE